MSTTIQVATPGLARDIAPEVGSEANALRRAENVVVRAAGVVETRPSFDLVYESDAFVASVRALREFDGVPLAIVKTGSSWGIKNLNTGVTLGGLDMAPVDYDEAETAFAESRQNLYMTSLVGIGALESPTSVTGVRVTGIAMMMQTDLTASQSVTVNKTSCAYRIVFVRKDSNGYVRRSPPSQRIICTLTGAPQTFGVATEIYFTPGMAAGDQIEIYRSLSSIGISPRPEHYLATTYTLTAADIALGHTATTITDSTPDDLLGAELYTDSARDTATAEKFPPPQAQALAWWQRVMWYGRTKAPSRMVLQLQNLYFAGIASFCTYHRPLGSQPRNWTFDTMGGATVTTSDTSGISDIIGMEVTDALTIGPSIAMYDGTTSDEPPQWCKPGTRVLSFVANTSVTLSQGTYTADPAKPHPATVPVMGLPVQPVNGLDAFSIIAMSGTVGVDQFVTFAPNRVPLDVQNINRIRSGMYITDSANGPSVNGTVFAANTRIIKSGISPTGYFIDKAPLLSATSVSAFVGDIITVNGVDFYAWVGDNGTPWGAPQATYRHFGIGDPQDTTSAGPDNAALAIQNLCATLTSYAFQHAGFPRATPIGDTWDRQDHEYGTDGLRQTPGTLATSFLLESDFASPITVKCSSLTAFPLSDRVDVSNVVPLWPDPIVYQLAEQVSDDATTPNRVCFSALDEPEAVPLLNYIDIGSKSQPILALVPLRNALLVFKTDGLWRITGAGPTGWSVDPLDMTLNLLRPEAVCVSQNKAYCWAKGGIFEVDENGARSLTVGKLDVELRSLALAILSDPTTHGTWATAVQTRNLVLFGVPGAAGDQFTSKVYCYHQTTGAWTEWPVSWGKACPSASFDTMYQSRPDMAAGGGLAEIDIEVRKMQPTYDGIDRTYPLTSPTVSGTTITISDSHIGTWHPTVGDWISTGAVAPETYRRITDAQHASTTWTLTLEAPLPTGGERSYWASEAIVMTLEWHPTAPPGLPIGTIARESQIQLDLRLAPDEDAPGNVSIPRYLVGGTTDRGTFATLTSNMPRIAAVQPLRVGMSRQIARAANLAPYFQTSDVYAIRVVGLSLVFEGVSERTRR